MQPLKKQCLTYLISHLSAQPLFQARGTASRNKESPAAGLGGHRCCCGWLEAEGQVGTQMTRAAKKEAQADGAWCVVLRLHPRALSSATGMAAGAVSREQLGGRCVATVLSCKLGQTTRNKLVSQIYNM